VERYAPRPPHPVTNFPPPEGGQPAGVGMRSGFSLQRERAASFIICLGCLIEMSGELVEWQHPPRQPAGKTLAHFPRSYITFLPYPSTPLYEGQRSCKV